MLAIADQFPEWKDFPRGLRVMLVDEDVEVIDDVRQKLEANGYVVTCYSKGLEALQALADRNNNHNSFHVVVVDVSRSDSFDGFEIVAAAKHLTAIMMASTENMNLMMQGIAAGASEILQKPLSEERLKNIWQHVVRKALVTGHFAAPTTDIAADLEPLTSPSLTVCKDDNQSNANVKQEEETCSTTPHHDCKPDQDRLPGRFPADGGRVLVFREQEAENHDGSSYFDMDEKTFLCSTPPQLEQTYSRIPTCTDHEDNAELTAASPTPSHSQDFSVACMQRELNEIHECFDDCDSYLHMKSEVEDAVNNSAILNELFESQMSASKPENHSDNFLLGSSGDGQAGMGNGELSNTSKFCDDLEFDGMDDITVFSGDLLDDGNGDQSLSIGFDCFDDEDIQEADEEALLLAEVAKAEEGMCNVSNQNVKKLNGSVSKLVTDGSTSNNGCQPDADELYNRCKSDSEQSCNIKGSKSSSNGKKKMKVDWTPELHRRFVQAVEQLGVDKAIPSRILDLMGVKCLTRHNIASHLQKYRSHRKHVLAREVEVASWNQRRHMDHAWRPASGPKPPVVQAAPPPHPRPALAAAPPALHVWGHPPVEHAMHFWPAWPAPTACPVDAWGNPFFMPAQPILRVPLAPMPSVANIMPATCGKLANLHPPKETVVAAINEVLRNPYIPLPLGLKPPSLESVVSELHRQGVCMAPTHII